MDKRNELADRRMDEWMDGDIVKWMDRWIDGGCMDGGMDGWVEK